MLLAALRIVTMLINTKENISIPIPAQISVNVGDIVLYANYSGVIISPNAVELNRDEKDPDEFIILEPRDILGIIETKEKK